jgi:hypothetical protein
MSFAAAMLSASSKCVMVLSCSQANLSSLLNPVLHPPILRVALFSGACIFIVYLSIEEGDHLCVGKKKKKKL